MSNDDDNLSKLIWHIVVPLLVGIVILFLEYWSGWFNQHIGIRRSWHLPGGSLTAVSIALAIITTFAFVQCLLVWLRPDLYVREDFAFVGLLLIVSLSALISIVFLSGVMPWSAIEVVFQRLVGGPTPQPETTKWSDYAFLFLLYLILGWAIIHTHYRWSGLKSIDQYQREQRNESTSIFVDAFRELKRILTRGPTLKTYNEKDPKDFITQLKPVRHSLAWRDQARELLCLSSSSYAFDPDTSWHDLEGCWVGSNINTSESIFLFPCQDELTDEDIDRCCEAAQRLSNQKHSTIGEIVIAV